MIQLQASVIASNGRNPKLLSMPRASSHRAHQLLPKCWQSPIGYYGTIQVVVAIAAARWIAWAMGSALRVFAFVMREQLVNTVICVLALLQLDEVRTLIAAHMAHAIVVRAIVPWGQRARVAHGRAHSTNLPLRGSSHVPLRHPFGARVAKSA